MKCNACGAAVEEGRAKCGVCGFPVIQNVSEDASELENIRIMGQEYLKRYLDGMEIGIKVYGYVMKDKKLVFDSEENFVLAKAAELKVGQNLWTERSFVNVDDDGTATVTAFVRKGEKEKIFELSVKLKRGGGDRHMGITLEEGLKVQLLLGNSENYVQTEPFHLKYEE